MPTSPTKAVQRFPSQRMRPWLSSTRKAGIRSSSASLSVENRGQSGENEQHAPQAWHTATPSSSESTASSIIDQSTCTALTIVRARAPTGLRGTLRPRTYRPLPAPAPANRRRHHSDSTRKTCKNALVRSPRSHCRRAPRPFTVGALLAQGCSRDARTAATGYPNRTIGQSDVAVRRYGSEGRRRDSAI
jgi:hypothetical protein